MATKFSNTKVFNWFKDNVMDSELDFSGLFPFDEMAARIVDFSEKDPKIQKVISDKLYLDIKDYAHPEDYYEEVHKGLLNLGDSDPDFYEIYQEAMGDIKDYLEGAFEVWADEFSEIQMALAEEIEENPDMLVDRGDGEIISDFGDYLVLTDGEADELALERARDLIDDLGFSNFTESFKSWIIQNALEEDWFKDAMRESYEFYIYDMDEEENIEQLDGHGIKDRDFFFEEDEDGDEVRNNEDPSDWDEELIDSMVRESGYKDDPVGWYIDNFGEEGLDELLRSSAIYMDEKKVAQEIIDQDGRASILAGYDGEEREVEWDGETYYIYRTN